MIANTSIMAALDDDDDDDDDDDEYDNDQWSQSISAMSLS